MTTNEENHRVLTAKLKTEQDFDTPHTKVLNELEDITKTIRKKSLKEGSKDLSRETKTAVNYFCMHESFLTK